MDRPVDPRKRRTHRIVYAFLAVAIVGGIGIMLAGETEKLSTKTISPADLSKSVGPDPYDDVIVDLRAADDFARGHIPFAVSIPKAQVGRRMAELSQARERQVVLACDAGPETCGDAPVFLQRNGFQSVLTLEGGMEAWRAAGLPTDTKDDSPFRMR